MDVVNSLIATIGRHTKYIAKNDKKEYDILTSAHWVFYLNCGTLRRGDIYEEIL
jgi:hypothetical protein